MEGFNGLPQEKPEGEKAPMKMEDLAETADHLEAEKFLLTEYRQQLAEKEAELQGLSQGPDSNQGRYAELAEEVEFLRGEIRLAEEALSE